MRKKRSRVVFLLIIVLSIIIILAVIILANLATQSSRTVSGVKAGDMFTYELKGLWESSDPKVTITDTMLEVNMTEWYRVAITEVSEPEISIHTVWRFKNGTEVEGDGKVDIATGLSSGGFWAIYAPNLKAGDYLRPKGPDRSTINETTKRYYGAGNTRETNRLSLDLEYYDANEPTTTWTEYMDIHFDRQTGMLVELRDTSLYVNPEMTVTLIWTIRDTNIWAIS